MKRVSFEVAKYLKEVGYPQDKSEYNEGYAISEVHYKVYSSRDDRWYSNSAAPGRMLSFDDDYYYPEDCGEYCVAPYYLNVWLWLWREKDIRIVAGNLTCFIWQDTEYEVIEAAYSDPEQVIVEAIEYLVNNKRLK